MRIILSTTLALACLAVAACATAQTGNAAIEPGFVASNHGNAFLYTTDAHLLPTSTIQFQYPAGKDAVACCLRLQGSALDAPSASTEPVSDALLGQPVFRYRLKQVPAELKDDPFVAAAVIGAASLKSEATAAGMTMQLRRASAASAATVQVCLGSEGSNLFLLADGKVKAQIYYSFGYDVTPTCDPKLFDLPATP
jgi:hypothetical protein